MHKMIFIEGLPGSGKTTFAKRLKEYLESNNQKVLQLSEGDLHPIDLAWCSIIDRDTFNVLMLRYARYKEEIFKLSKFTDEQVITAYTKVRVDKEDDAFYSDFSKYEIYRTESFEHFKNTHLDLWSKFDGQPDMVYIFECIFLQNHINELVLKFNKSEEEIYDYFNDLMSKVSKYNPVVFYIKQIDVIENLDKIIKERVTNDPTRFKDWIDLVVEYFEGTKFGKELGYIGKPGALQYFKDRQELELRTLKQATYDSNVYDLSNFDYDIIFEQMKKDI